MHTEGMPWTMSFVFDVDSSSRVHFRVWTQTLRYTDTDITEHQYGVQCMSVVSYATSDGIKLTDF